MEKNIERLFKNYSNARTSWETWCYLNNYELKTKNPELRRYTDSSSLLRHLRFLSHKDFYIEMNKIINQGRNNKDNIFILLENAKVINPDLSEEISIRLSELYSLEEVFAFIIDLRDKFFAHLDNNYEDYLIPFGVKELQNCFHVIEKCLITLTDEKTIIELLELIPSRNDFSLLIPPLPN